MTVQGAKNIWSIKHKKLMNYTTSFPSRRLHSSACHTSTSILIQPIDNPFLQGNPSPKAQREGEPKTISTHTKLSIQPMRD